MRTTTRCILLSALAVAAFGVCPNGAVHAQGSIADYWDEPIQLRNLGGTDGLAPVHATLLPNGDVLLSGVYRPGPKLGWDAVLTPRPVGDLGPATRFLPTESPPLEHENEWVTPTYRADDSYFCAGHTLLADGQVMVVGGTRLNDWFSVVGPDIWWTQQLAGLDTSVLYDYRTGGWSAPEQMVGLGPGGLSNRWYATATRLADGRVLATSGWEYNFIKFSRWNGTGWDQVGPTYWGTSVPNLSTEVYDPTAAPGSRFTEATHWSEAPPNIFNRDYTHVWQLPAGPGWAPDDAYDVLMIGEQGYPTVLSMSAPITPFVESPAQRGAGAAAEPPLHGASSVMLPLRLAEDWGYSNGSVMVVGGGDRDTLQSRANVYDTDLDAWTTDVDLLTHRHHPSTVLMPDGRIAVLAGHDDQDPGQENRRVQYLDPRDGAFSFTEGTTTMSTAPEPGRGYHTVSALLPDGRILVGGGRSDGAHPPEDERPDLQYLYPWYFFYETIRPAIVSAPTTIQFGQTFEISWTRSITDLEDVVLISLASMTHSFDHNQRYVQLAASIEQIGKTAIVTAPADGRSAPPGHYMLFVVDAFRLPSHGQIVRLQ